MKEFGKLKKKIQAKKARIAIIGLGYVGLPLAVSFAKKGFFVYGLDNNTSRIEKLRNKVQYILDINPKDVTTLIKSNKLFPTVDKKILNDADVMIICVPTPLRKVKSPDISYIIEASRSIKKYMKKGQLIVLESTSYPTTTREVVLPLLKDSGLKEEEDFFLCFSPERVNPGDKGYPVMNIPKVVGGLSFKSTQLARILYSKIINKVFPVASPEVAETSKLLENTFRLVNIALINEFAIVCNRLGISIWDVVEAAKTKPFGFMSFYPGPGIGGHCIPCDPLYLSWKSKKIGFKTKMIDLASFVNHYMPQYVVERVEDLLGDYKVIASKAKILILGVTYKKDVKDLRESPALDIIDILQSRGYYVDYYDPLIPYLKFKNIDLKRIVLSSAAIREYSCIILVTEHTNVNYQSIRRNAQMIFDTRNIYKRNHDNVRRL